MYALTDDQKLDVAEVILRGDVLHFNAEHVRQRSNSYQEFKTVIADRLNNGAMQERVKTYL